MSELPDFLSDEPRAASEAEAPAPASEPVAQTALQPTPEAPEGTLRGPDGRFAPVEATPAPVAAEPLTAAPVEPVHSVPLATFLDLRDKATAAEKRAADLQQWRDQQEAQSRQPLPSRDEDPEAYEAHQRQAMDDSMFVMRRDFSRNFANITHGQQTVDAAFEWGADLCGKDPHFNAKVRAHPDPVNFVVSEWKRDQVASKVDPSRYEAFLAWEASGGASPASAQPGAQPAPTPAPVAPRPSLAGGPSAGDHAQAVPADGEQQFARMFGQ
jgi:hypothetical protein